MDYKELLCELLSCGYGDVEMLFKIKYDFETSGDDGEDEYSNIIM